ncbi:hypothetical protein QSD79_003826 [Escherichia coli]|nr:hypothetical protein [Escherichia coli]ELJ0190845.1 hypothetical protein [Escherichia coli]
MNTSISLDAKQQDWGLRISELQNLIIEGKCFLENKPKHFLLWDVIALYMNLKIHGPSPELIGVETYLRSIPGMNLEELELPKEALNYHGYLAHSINPTRLVK